MRHWLCRAYIKCLGSLILERVCLKRPELREVGQCNPQSQRDVISDRGVKQGNNSAWKTVLWVFGALIMCSV